MWFYSMDILMLIYFVVIEALTMERCEAKINLAHIYTIYGA